MKPTEHWRPTTTTDGLKARAALLQDIRNFFAGLGVMEVETPLLSNTGNTDPEIQSIMTDCGQYLRSSPEFSLKRLLAAGSGDIFELGRVFRAGESGRSHNPEFTMLEWYRTGFSYQQLIDEVALLVRHCGHGKFDRWPVEKISYRDLFVRHLQLDPHGVDSNTLATAAARHGVGDIELEHKQWLDLLISHVIQPALPAQALTFVYDYPADQAALARVRPGSPPLAERFELYLGRIELANGYQELTDAGQQQQRFEMENKERERQGKPRNKADHHLITALEHGLPDCAGVALGVDRLLMNLCNADTLNEVIAFPSSRA